VLGHQGLHKEDAALRVQARRQPIERNILRVLAQVRGVSVIGGQGVPIGDKKVAVVIVLQADPVVKGAHVVAEMQFAGRAHAAQHTLEMGSIRILIHWLDCTEILQIESSKTRKNPSTGFTIAMVTRPPKNNIRKRLRMPRRS
jgi:hypothetical protein